MYSSHLVTVDFVAAQLTYKWHGSAKTKHMLVDGKKVERYREPNTTDGVRGERGFTRGTHKFVISVDSDGGWGSFAQIGVCDSKADMQMDCTKMLLPMFLERLNSKK